MGKGRKKIFGILLLLACVAIPVHAQETGHYVSGVEGIRAATLPPPGMYWRMYSVLYDASDLVGKDGEELPVGFDLSVFALVNRFIWITDYKILGADFGMDLIVPVLNTDIKISALGVEDDQFALGDITIEPFVLAWHGPRYDAAFGIALYMPTGDYDIKEPASAGKDMWTTMLTLGGTYYFDRKKTLSASILSRYEIHSEKDERNITPGDDFHFEWGIGKNINKVWDLGITGYCHWQVTDDDGDDVAWDRGVHDQVFSVGPEVGFFYPPGMLGVSLRSQWEFEAEDRSEGMVHCLTFTKIF